MGLMKSLKVIFIAFLCGISTVCVYKYLTLLQERNILLDRIEKTEVELQVSYQEKQNLLQELEKDKQRLVQLEKIGLFYKGNLRASRRKIALLQAVRAQNDKLALRINILKFENVLLRRKQERMMQRIDQIAQEDEGFRLKFSSANDTYTALQDLGYRPDRGLLHIIKKGEEALVIEGNRGYLIKDGKPTYPLQVNIKVAPASKYHERSLFTDYQE